MKRMIVFFLIMISVQLMFGEEFYRLDQFSRELMDQGDYLNSIIECKRIISYYPTERNILSKTFQIARCYELMGEYQRSATYYKEFLKLSPGDWKAIRKLILVQHRDKKFIRSNEYINEYLPVLNPEQRDSLRFISAFNFVHLGEYEKARTNFEVIKDQVLYKEGVKYQDILNYEIPLPYKNKNQAIFLGALMPGGGFLYVNKFNHALLSLISTALFAYTSVECFDDGKTGAGLLTGGISFGIYISAIVSSVKLVEEYNNEVRKDFNDKFRL